MAGPLAAQTAGATGAPRGGRFSRFANATARLSGRPATFILATLTIVVWGASGPYFNYSDTWQLVINTGTTIVTFLMVFVIQNTQNRDTLALQLKLDELILANKNASNAIVAVEEEPDEKLEELKQTEKQKAHATPSR
jgi:low affinity Fe/Cu permease